MAYTEPQFLVPGTAVLLNPTQITTTGAKTATTFAVPKWSGQFWGQITLQAIPDTLTALVVTLEADLTGATSESDDNFDNMFAGLDMYNNPILPLNLNGGNARYRFNVTTLTGDGVDFWALVG